MSSSELALFALWYPVFLFSLTFHEAAHAWIAKRGGDYTAYLGGQVSLNPLPHMRREILGTIVAPLLTFLTAGWMMGWASTPFDPRWARQYPDRAAWMSLAGPVANFALVLAAALAMWLGAALGWFVPPPERSFSAVVAAPGMLEPVATALSILFSLNLLLGCFNLLPVPPLDGAAALTLLLPRALAERWQGLMQQPTFQWVGLILAWRLFGVLFAPLHAVVLALVYTALGFY